MTGDDERRAEIEAPTLGGYRCKRCGALTTDRYGHGGKCATWPGGPEMGLRDYHDLEPVRLATIDRVRRAPGPSSQDAETDAHLVAERAIAAYLAAIPSSRERDAEIRAETIAEVVAWLRAKLEGPEAVCVTVNIAGFERHFAAPPARNDEHGTERGSPRPKA